MQLLLFVSLALLGSIVDGKAVRAGHRCCAADQWYGTMGATMTTLEAGATEPTINQYSAQIDMDWSKQRERLVISGVVNMQYPYNVTIYQDYSLHKQYTLMTGSQCNVTDSANKPFPPCVPDDFTYGGRTTIGSGDNSLQEDTWYGTWEGMQVSMGVAVGSCTPISFSSIGTTPSGVRVEMTAGYSGVVQETLSSPDAVSIPAKCHAPIDLIVGK